MAPLHFHYFRVSLYATYLFVKYVSASGTYFHVQGFVGTSNKRVMSEIWAPTRPANRCRLPECIKTGPAGMLERLNRDNKQICPDRRMYDDEYIYAKGGKYTKVYGIYGQDVGGLRSTTLQGFYDFVHFHIGLFYSRNSSAVLTAK